MSLEPKRMIFYTDTQKVETSFETIQYWNPYWFMNSVMFFMKQSLHIMLEFIVAIYDAIHNAKRICILL